MPETLKVGLIGAGANTRAKHISGLQKQSDVEITAVANRSFESGEKVAEEFGIPTVCEDWMEIIADGDIDAVCIGTWPYMHAGISIAAIEAGKHVLCEARMAANYQEALAMLDTSRQNPDITCQVVPAPHTLSVDRTITDLLADGYLGSLVHVRAFIAAGGGFPDPSLPFHWRHDRDLSGNNIMTMGIWYEAVMRWVGPASTVMANAQTVVKQRKDGEGRLRALSIPDHVDILCDMAAGGTMNLTVSTVLGLAPSAEVWLHGTEGTLKIESTDFSDPGAPVLKVYGGRLKDGSTSEITVPDEKRGGWRVEDEFVNAIRKIEPVTHTSFEDGVKYMQWTDAVTESWVGGEKVSLLLP